MTSTSKKTYILWAIFMAAFFVFSTLLSARVSSTAASSTAASSAGASSANASSANASSTDADRAILEYLEKNAVKLETSHDLMPLIDRIGDAKVVLLGEASHGTAEYYVWRAHITRKLIQKKGFNIIAVEGDWPAFFEVDGYIKSPDDCCDSDLTEVMDNFQRWPRWMWANHETTELISWLKEYNSTVNQCEMVSFYGMDVYSLPESLKQVQEYASAIAEAALQSSDISVPDILENPASLEDAAGDSLIAARITKSLECIARFRHDPQQYARQAARGFSCEEQVLAALRLIRDNEEMLIKTGIVAFGDKPSADRAYFNALQNAYVLKNVERHYRAMGQRGNSWNKRVFHMHQTIKRLLDYHGSDSRIIVWAHNTHIGDARATSMAASGMKNIGWLCREEYGRANVVAVGFGTCGGTVKAGSHWGSTRQKMTVPDALPGSLESLFGQHNEPDFLLIFDDTAPASLHQPQGHRAIGVVYNPSNERGNYVPTILPARYDAFLFFRRTEALSPLP